MPALVAVIFSIIRIGGAWLLRGAVQMAPYFLFRALAGAGVAYVGKKLVVDPLKVQIVTWFSGMPAKSIDVATACGFDIAVTMIFSAYAIRIASRLVAQHSSTSSAAPPPAGP